LSHQQEHDRKQQVDQDKQGIQGLGSRVCEPEGSII
jgi:hypothetical protein